MLPSTCEVLMCEKITKQLAQLAARLKTQDEIETFAESRRRLGLGNPEFAKIDHTLFERDGRELLPDYVRHQCVVWGIQ